MSASIAAPARADEVVDSCLSAHQDGQRLAQEGRFRDARAAFARCAIDSCPVLVRNDCSKRGEAARSALGSVRLALHDGAGTDAEGVSVAIDGAEAVPLTEESLELDPGRHRVRFHSRDGRSVVVDFELARGQMDMPVRGVLPHTSRAPTESPAAPPSSVPGATWAFGAVALAGFGGFAVWGLAGRSAESDLDACKPGCTDKSRYDAMKRDYILADVSLGVGVLGAALATYFYVQRSEPRREPPPATRLNAVPLRGGAAVGLVGDF